jgi:imidazolonepropionase-like amidohydrolase
MRKSILLLLSLCLNYGFAQQTFPVNGVENTKPNLYAITNATVIPAPGQKIENATILIKGEVIELVGTNLSVPKGYITVNAQGKFIYPAFIESYSAAGIEEAKKGGRNNQPQFISSKEGAYGWNQAVKPEIDAYTMYQNPKNASDLRKMGFATIISHQKDGIVRGTSTAALLNDKRENEQLIKQKVASYYSFNKGTSTQDFPSSQMGCIALLRQTFYDAQWYKNSKKKHEENISLSKLNENQSLPKVFEVTEVLEVMRADKVGKEFGYNFIIKCNNDAYQKAAWIKKSGNTLIVPLKFPEAYDVSDVDMARKVSTSDMLHWKNAPYNAYLLNQAGVEFMFTAADDEKNFLKNLRKSVELGLPPEKALSALTTLPAQKFGLNNIVGTIEKGKLANLIISDKNLFEKDAQIQETWVSGVRFAHQNPYLAQVEGNYDLTLDGKNYKTKLTQEEAKLSFEISINDTSKVKGEANLNEGLISGSLENPSNKEEKLRISGYIDGKSFKGTFINAENTKGKWSATYASALQKDSKKDTSKAEKHTPQILYPFADFGYDLSKAPTAKTVLIKNVTVWTLESDGKLDSTDVLISGGKISKIGKNLPSSGADEVIDGTGKHLTPGIIDEHSHIAISKGVNDIQTVSSEVRIGDVLDSEDVNIYRQLAGGVTTSHLLHGSANPIGGQTALIKLRWGKSPEEMKFENADGFIKFALGENVKQSNWGDDNVSRYPQTRMGVEQVYFDAFWRAKQYQKNLTADPVNTRRDLELDALSEILNDKRFITCHSYVQTEINMLMHVADSMGFKVNTFTHILEGYKVADKMKARNVNASTFSDWWAYKYEVIEAIPYNAAIMHGVGVNVAINSDDAEMARRLNQEAAKTIKYGGLSEIEALKTVTLNPAKMLHIDNRVGSIKVGKDADLVLWNTHPLSIKAVVEKTMVDGVIYYDKAANDTVVEANNQLRNQLIQDMIAEKNGGGKTQKPQSKKKLLYHCNTLEN